MKHFIYLRGQPATGKITVARLLEERLHWKLFWFHDLKNAVFDIVKVHRIPRLMDELTNPIIKFLLENGDDIIYVRPSPDAETIKAVERTVAAHPKYQLHVVRLEADYDTLLARAEKRGDPYRISNKKDLDDYVNARAVADFPGEIVIGTADKTPEQVADAIVASLQLQK